MEIVLCLIGLVVGAVGAYIYANQKNSAIIDQKSKESESKARVSIVKNKIRTICRFLLKGFIAKAWDESKIKSKKLVAIAP